MEGKKRAAQSQKVKSPKKSKKGSKNDAAGAATKIKRPLSAYLYFTKDFRAERAEKGEDNSRVNEVAKLAGARWREMTEEDKKKYQKQANADKERYQRESGKNVKQDSDKPKRNATAYFIFLSEFRKQMANTKLTEGQKIPSLAGEKWRSMTDEDKQPYLKIEAKEKAKYEEAMKEYKKKVKEVPKPEKKPVKSKKKVEPEQDEDEDEEEDDEDDDDAEDDDDDDDDDE